jgi:hypothetical protein
MKRIIIAIALLAMAGSIWSQDSKSLLIEGSWSGMPQYRMQGAGYALSYQHSLLKLISLEAGAGFIVTSRTIERDQVVGDVRLLDLNYHHAGYYLYAAPVLKIGRERAVSLDLYAGPVVNYQSSVFDRNRYEMTESPDFIGRMTDIVYTNKVLEGTFFGGITGCRVNVRVGENWKMHLGVNTIGILKAVSSVNASIGVQFSW